MIIVWLTVADGNANYQSDLGSLKVNRIIHFRVSISQNVPVLLIQGIH